MKNYYDRNANLTKYSVGDAVRFHNPVRKKRFTLKLQRSWKGPYIVIKKFSDILYKIQKGPRDEPKVLHHDRPKPYNGENKPMWFQN